MQVNDGNVVHAVFGDIDPWNDKKLCSKIILKYKLCPNHKKKKKKKTVTIIQSPL